MKRKILVGVLAFIMCFTLVGCGKSESNNGGSNNSEKNEEEKSYISFTGGEKYKFSELAKMEKENTYSFQQKYCSYSSSTKAEYVVGKLSKILEEKKVDYGSQYLNFLVVELFDGDFRISVEIEKERNSTVISEMKIGDYLKITNIGALQCDCYANSCDHKLYNANAEIVR